MAVDLDGYAADEDFVDDDGVGHGGGMTQDVETRTVQLEILRSGCASEWKTPSSVSGHAMSR